MSAFEFKLPDIGEGVTEGEVVEWHVAVGDAVREDDPMVEVMTDKATVTIGAPREGTISELRFDVGAIAQVGEVLVVIDLGAGGAAAKPVAAPKAAPPKAAAPQAATARVAKDEGPVATAVGDIKQHLPGSKFFAGEAQPAGSGGNGATAAAVPVAGDHFAERPLATPATRKLARDLDVDLRRVQPTGRSGRVTKDDVRRFASGAPTQQAPVVGAAAGAGPARAPIAINPPPEDRAREDRKPFVGIRRRIAERMQTVKNTAAHFTFVEECEVDRLMDLRTRLKPAAAEAGVQLSYLPFIVKAVVGALKKHPVLNSALDESTNELVQRRYYHIGIAAATDMGLVVPVVREADQLTILELATEIQRLGDAARAGELTPGELTGSTFTITSLGRQGGLFATPILNMPEVGILGVHRIKEKPVVRDGELAVGNVMLLSLSFDHRIVDGHVGAAFAYDIIDYLEEPGRLMLEMS